MHVIFWNLNCPWIYVENLGQPGTQQGISHYLYVCVFFLFIFFPPWVEVVSHILFEASRNIIAQCRLSQKKRREQDREGIRGITFEGKKCCRITCACPANGRWHQGQDRIGGCVCLCACTVIEMQSVDYRALRTKGKEKTPKGLNTEGSSLKQSNLFIWVLIFCFSAWFHCGIGLLNPRVSWKINDGNTFCFTSGWTLVVREMKKVTMNLIKHDFFSVPW